MLLIGFLHSIIAVICFGILYSMIFTIAFRFIDDNITKENANDYISSLSKYDNKIPWLKPAIVSLVPVVNIIFTVFIVKYKEEIYNSMVKRFKIDEEN